MRVAAPEAGQPELRRAPVAAVVLPEAVVAEALEALAGAAGRVDIADAVTAVLARLPGVRAAAVLQRSQREAVVIGSTGYGCDTMSYGARLPLDSGMPATDAIRTGQVVRMGEGPGWIAAPFGRRTATPGSLLLSCEAAPPAAETDVARLQRLAGAVGAALARAVPGEQVSVELAAVLAGLAPAGVATDGQTAVRQVPRGGPVGGDVVLSLTEEGTRWFVVADVCGSGLAAAAEAAAVRTAARTLIPYASGPADLLRMLDRAIRPDVAGDRFVTAVAACLRDGLLSVATAGHPPPLLLTGSGVHEVPVEPGPPLAMETSGALPPLAEHCSPVPADALLVLYTDGLTDRRGAHGIDGPALARAAAAARSPEEAATLLLAAAESAGAAVDDTSLLVARTGGVRSR